MIVTIIRTRIVDWLGASAVTVWPVVFVSPSITAAALPQVLKHENVHLAQQRRWLVYGLGVGLLACVAVSLALTGALPTPAKLASVQPADLAGGLIVAFYVVSATLVAPRFGVGNLILFAMVAQIVFSAAIDHYGLLGVPVRPVSVVRIGGLLLMTAGLVITQFANSK